METVQIALQPLWIRQMDSLLATEVKVYFFKPIQASLPSMS